MLAPVTVDHGQVPFEVLLRAPVELTFSLQDLENATRQPSASADKPTPAVQQSRQRALELLQRVELLAAITYDLTLEACPEQETASRLEEQLRFVRMSSASLQGPSFDLASRRVSRLLPDQVARLRSAQAEASRRMRELESVLLHLLERGDEATEDEFRVKGLPVDSPAEDGPSLPLDLEAL